MMNYVAAIDYEHLDNGVFLKTLANALGRQEQVKPILIHGDSEYTERVIQTGVMREEAQIRGIKDMNHRLVALFADEGVSTIGMNGYQRKFVTWDGEQITIDLEYYRRLADKPVLLLSTLAYNSQTGRPDPVALPALMNALNEQISPDELFIFFRSGKDDFIKETDRPESMRWNEITGKFAEQFIPEEFRQFNRPVRMAEAGTFGEIPDTSSTTLVQ